LVNIVSASIGFQPRKSRIGALKQAPLTSILLFAYPQRVSVRCDGHADGL